VRKGVVLQLEQSVCLSLELLRESAALMRQPTHTAITITTRPHAAPALPLGVLAREVAVERGRGLGELVGDMLRHLGRGGLGTGRPKSTSEEEIDR